MKQKFTVTVVLLVLIYISLKLRSAVKLMYSSHYNNWRSYFYNKNNVHDRKHCFSLVTLSKLHGHE